MKATGALLCSTVLAIGGALAADQSADRAIGRQLDQLKYTYEVDADGDYKLVFDTEDGRTQLIFVRSNVETFGAHHVREIWSPAYRARGAQFPAPVANRLLEASNESKLGSWVKQGDTAMFVVKLDADASVQSLSDALDAALRTADAMERELTSEDEF